MRLSYFKKCLSSAVIFLILI
jgi:NhaP-type Na+/H+ or K+/H+ antiporter